MTTGLLRRMNSVREITDVKETWKIAVRLINMWTVPRASRFNIELIFMDKEGDKILAQIRNVEIANWNELLIMGKTYVVQNFEVEKNSGQYKPATHPFKMNIVKATKITPRDLPEIPESVYNFTLFDAIINGTATPDFLIDVIGEVVEIGQWSLDGKPKKVIFTLKDECGSVMTCTLWEALAMEFRDCLDKHENGPIVLLLNMAKIKEAKGPYPVAIQNSMYGSHVFVNADMNEIQDFKNRLEPTQLSLINCSQVRSQYSGSSSYAVGDRFMHNAEVKYLSELSKLKKECMCVTVATITKLLVANGWIYDSCPKCNKKVDANVLPFVCVGCGNESSTTIPKFRVEVRVAQPRETAIFTLWDRDCHTLINQTASDIKQSIVDEEGDFDPRDIPESLDRVLGKKCAFRFKVVPGNTRHSVSLLSQDEALINSVVSKLAGFDILDDEDGCLSSVQRSEEVRTQSLSATAESEPNGSTSITPAKRNLLLSDSQLDALPFEDLSCIQLSSTRVSKHIKSE